MWPMMATEADWPATPASDEASRLAVLRARLAAPMPDDRPWGWLGPLLVTAFGAFLRFNRLRVPRALIFDETYYAKDGWSILNHGVELSLANNANAIIQAGHTHIFAPCNGTSACGGYVGQPEIGKLLSVVGEWLRGRNCVGWRLASSGPGSGSAGGGWRPGSASAWPWAPSGTRPGTSSASPRWSPRGTSARAARPG